MAAESGDVDAQYRIAEAYRLGIGVPRSDKESIHWYRRAAESGHAAAQNDLGSMYQNGLGTEPNSREAARWYRLAAEQGALVAQFNLALRYLHGTGVQQDDQEAALWLQRAAVQGYVEAIGQLGTLYRFGRGVEQDFVMAAALHVAAALDGDVVSMGNLADYHEDVERAALKGSLGATLSLVRMFNRGVGVPKDHVQALAWLLVGEKTGTFDGDTDCAEELATAKRFYDTNLSDADKKKAKRLSDGILAGCCEPAVGMGSP
jgi:TPR repeat protein